MGYFKARARLFATMCALSLAACGGGGGGDASSPPTPSVSIADQFFFEPISGTNNGAFRLTLSAAASSTVTVAYASTNNTATSGQDYATLSGIVTFLAGETSKTVSVSIFSDATSELDETFTVTLSNPIGATIARSAATVMIVDRVSINDTGITTCGNAASNLLTCSQSLFPGQDAEIGRDVSNPVSTDGRAGFEFTKLDANGNALAANASSWDCVRDEVTGMVWEVKPNNSGNLHHRDHTYSWYNTDSSSNGGGAGSQTGGGGSCTGSISCNTSAYVQAVNTAGLCGSNSWRLPSTEELLSIRDYGGSTPAIDMAYFPDIGNTYAYWVSEPYSSDPVNNARIVTFSTGAGGTSSASKSSFAAHIRLVH